MRAFQSLGHELLVLTPSRANEEILGASVARIPAPALLEELLADAERLVAGAHRDGQRAKNASPTPLGTCGTTSWSSRRSRDG